MIKRINEHDFVKAFDDMDRSNNFTVEGRRALFNYLTGLEDSEYEIELDVIALCCSCREYSNIDEYLQDYKHDPRGELETEEEFKDRIEEEITEKTVLIKIGDDLDEGFITGIESY